MVVLGAGWVVVYGVDDRQRDRLCRKNPLRARDPVLVSELDKRFVAQTAGINCGRSDWPRGQPGWMMCPAKQTQGELALGDGTRSELLCGDDLLGGVFG